MPWEGIEMIKFFDANCMVGCWAEYQEESFWKTEDLLAEMDYFNIEQAMVYHSWSRNGEAAGNGTNLQSFVFADLWVGKRQGQEIFNGTIDDVRISSTARS